MNNVSSGKVPLNVNTMTQIDKTLSGIASDAYRSGNKQAGLAVKQVITALRNTPVKTDSGAKAIAMYEKARALAAKRFAKIDETPALKFALDDTSPDKFVQNFVLGHGSKANVKDVTNLVTMMKNDPETYQTARNQIMLYFKNKALNGNADEVCNFSPSATIKALKSFGDKKLKLFFPE